MSDIPSFPFKREFISPDELWVNAVNQDLSQLHVMEHKHWTSLPRRFKWEFTNAVTGQRQSLVFITSNEAYDQVDKLVDFFSEPARLQACRKGFESPLDYYQSHFAEIQTKANELANAQPDLPYRHHLREAVYSLSKECTTFKISLTKAILKTFKSRIVLDPSAGWGDRILGAAAAGVHAYHGIDPNPNLRESYDQILEFLRTQPLPDSVDLDKYTVLTEDFLKVSLVPESYDTVFTSPPFFDYEIYANDPKQSIQGRTSLRDWMEDFFQPYLRKAWEALAKGGYFILYISDVKGAHYVQNMQQYVTRELGGRFLGILGAKSEDTDFGWPIWVWRKT